MVQRIIAVLAVSSLLGAFGCMARSPVRGTEVTGLDRKLATHAFIEEGDLVVMVVDVRASRLHDESDYVPVEIAIANRGLKSLTLTRESFQLLDEEGNRFHVVSPRELMAHHDSLDYDRRLGELGGMLEDQKFATYTRYRSRFSPIRDAPPGQSTIVKDRVTLPRFGYLIDFLYFPRPETGLLEKRLELHMEAPELPDPVFVKFEVR